jgi:hypothetical protein
MDGRKVFSLLGLCAVVGGLVGGLSSDWAKANDQVASERQASPRPTPKMASRPVSWASETSQPIAHETRFRPDPQLTAQELLDAWSFAALTLPQTTASRRQLRDLALENDEIGPHGLELIRRLVLSPNAKQLAQQYDWLVELAADGQTVLTGWPVDETERLFVDSFELRFDEGEFIPSSMVFVSRKGVSTPVDLAVLLRASQDGVMPASFVPHNRGRVIQTSTSETEPPRSVIR